MNRATSPPARPSDTWPPSEAPHRLRTRPEAQRLAEYLLAPSRPFPAVVVSVAPGQPEPFIDADGICDEVRGVAVVFVVDADATFGLTDGLGDPRLSAFYGAGRVYPVGTRWRGDRYAAPLVMCPGPPRAQRAREVLIEEALAAAQFAGLLQLATPADSQSEVLGKVSGFSSDRHVLMRCDNGQQGVMNVSRLRVDVAPMRLVQRGQRFAGVLSGTGFLPEFVPAVVEQDVAALVRAECPDGSTVLAKVREVEAEGASVLLHPDYSVKLAEPGEDLRRLLSPGDVVAVEVAWVDGECLVALGDESAAHPALSVLPGGPSWLLPEAAGAEPGEAGRPEPPAGEQAGAAAPVESADALQELADARITLELYSEQISQLEEQVAREGAELKLARSDLRRARRERENRALPEVFADPERQFRWEVATSYLFRVPESQRDEYPLGDFVLGRAFLTRLDLLQGISRDKVMEVIVDVLSGRAKDIPARELHPWLESRSGPQETRDDGATAWRVSLQVHSHSARRLKYWRLVDGRIELDTVGVHDDGIR